MVLGSSVRLGPYEVTAAIGAGGMGEVYRARDTKLNRDVALKILPPAFAADPDRLARFHREAQVLASLNHPHIGAIYGFENSGDTHALVLEFVDGPTLADRIAQGPIAVDEALPIAMQIAGALEAAHEQGIIHRDLKPANIKLRVDGTVKVLDFGLAKLAEPGSRDAGSAGAMGAVSMSPTITSPAMMTGVGVMLGTAAYMAPEQARGKTVDKRADIWAFGCVLFEMLTGTRAFEGDEMTDVIVAVVSKHPDWSRLPQSTPQRLRELLGRCLEKDPRERLRDIGDARHEITSAQRLPVLTTREASPDRHPGRTTMPWIIAASAALVAIAAIVYAMRGASSSAAQPVSWRGDLVGGPAFAQGPRVSPDGQMVAFMVMVEGVTQVAVMRPGTGHWATLTTDRSHGLVQEIAWSPDGSNIYFDRLQDVPNGIFRVPVLGGEPRLVVENAVSPAPLADGSLVGVRLDQTRTARLFHFWPDTRRIEDLGAAAAAILVPAVRVFPDGKEAVFFGHPTAGSDTADDVRVVDLVSKTQRRLANHPPFAVTNWTFPLAVSGDGQDVFVTAPNGSQAQVLALRRDGGPWRPLFNLTGKGTYIDASRDGVLYSDLLSTPRELIAAKDGRMVRTPLPAEPIGTTPEPLSLPDGRTLVSTIVGGRTRVVAIAPNRDPAPLLESSDETRPPMTMLGSDAVALIVGAAPKETIAVVSVTDGHIIRTLANVDGGAVRGLAGSRDGSRLFYVVDGTIWLSQDGGTPTRFHAGDRVAVSPDGRYVVIELYERGGGRLIRVNMDGTGEQEYVIRSALRPATQGLFSSGVGPDGRLLVRVAQPDSWYFPLGLLDPTTGQLKKVWPEIEADMFGGWTQDGRPMAVSNPTFSEIWRFTPDRR